MLQYMVQVSDYVLTHQYFLGIQSTIISANGFKLILDVYSVSFDLLCSYGYQIDAVRPIEFIFPRHHPTSLFYTAITAGFSSNEFYVAAKFESSAMIFRVISTPFNIESGIFPDFHPAEDNVLVREKRYPGKCI